MQAMQRFKSMYARVITAIKRTLNLGFVFELARTLAAIVIALSVAAIIILIVSDDPGFTLRVFLLNPLTQPDGFATIFSRAMPLIFTGLAASVVLRAKQFNLFAEGAFFIGGFAGAIVAIHVGLPGLLLPVVALLAGGLVAAIFGTVPAALKAKLDVNEFVVSLMMNFILLWIGVYFLSNVFNDERAGDITTPLFPEHARIPYISQDSFFTSGVFIAIAAVILVFIFFRFTRFGYNIKTTGDNLAFAKYSGINPAGPIFSSQVIGAFIAGVGGATEVLSHYRRFNWTSLPMYGFDGFMIAIIAKNNPLAVLFVALFFGYIRTGAVQMEIFTRMSSEIVTIIQAVIILLVAAQAFLMSLRKRLMMRRIKGLKHVEATVEV